jgi:hypothetical protein
LLQTDGQYEGNSKARETDPGSVTADGMVLVSTAMRIGLGHSEQSDRGMHFFVSNTVTLTHFLITPSLERLTSYFVLS